MRADVVVTRLSASVFETAARSIRHSISYLTAGVDAEDRENVKLIAADLLNNIAEVLDKQALLVPLSVNTDLCLCMVIRKTENNYLSFAKHSVLAGVLFCNFFHKIT